MESSEGYGPLPTTRIITFLVCPLHLLAAGQVRLKPVIRVVTSFKL
jgi:hypothetical protein